ncbi:hypothetical protein GCM10012287_50580 [Streptomyces daqingensis]|uniref:Abortive phage infection protein C-terminal domain-containing protein n=1 Tax=Streptomyces daqingensis TaxID=1472640 RepID=A0ABQ2MVA6_9ACTN|nr:AIPR family protein [Streptomyces daqingensis]GGO56605.1 hypothetical protein GCM10012287_50580 [Streptomyces daqingensis]
MAKPSKIVSNEVLILEERIRQQKSETYPDLSDQDFFLINSTDTVLRLKGLSGRQVEDGIVDGSDDGGIDAVYLFLDGQLVEDTSEKSHGESPQLELEIIQAKYESGFKEVTLQRLLDHLPLLLQLDESAALGAEFNPRVLERFQSFRQTYLSVASKFPELSINIRYITKSPEDPHEKVRAKASRLERQVTSLFHGSRVSVELIGANELNSRARQRRATTSTLRLSEGPISSEKGGFVCLVSLADYFDFITEGDDRLRDEIFEENVRDYEGATVINRGIAQSLREGDASVADFWWLNNGVTIIGKRVQPSSRRLQIEDPQIVNGLQTSRNLYHYFHGLSRKDNETPASHGELRQLLVRVIETQDEEIAAQVIKATNSQNRVSAASLRSTEPFQRDIEEYFQRHGLYYERKKNHYKNLQKPRAQIVEVLELAQAVGAVLLQQPNVSRGTPSALVRGKLYERVFSTKTPLAAYLNCLLLVRTVDEFLAKNSGMGGRHDRSNVRFHLARSASAFALTSSRPRPKSLTELDLSVLTPQFLLEVYGWVIDARDRASKVVGTVDPSVLAKGAEWVAQIDRQLSRYTDKSRWPKKLAP